MQANLSNCNFIEQPFHIWIFDNVLPIKTMHKVLSEWPKSDNPNWFRGRPLINGHTNILEQGMLAISDKNKMPTSARALDDFFHSQSFCDQIIKSTGITNLTPDHSHRWSGMRTMVTGSHQLIHTDATRNPHTNDIKKLTILYYLNTHYHNQNDIGHLEIWSNDMSECVHKIEPIANRLVVFEVGHTSHHGVPKVTFDRYMMTSSLMSGSRFDTGNTQARFLCRPEDLPLVATIGEIRSSLGDV